MKIYSKIYLKKMTWKTFKLYLVLFLFITPIFFSGFTYLDIFITFFKYIAMAIILLDVFLNKKLSKEIIYIVILNLFVVLSSIYNKSNILSSILVALNIICLSIFLYFEIEKDKEIFIVYFTNFFQMILGINLVFNIISILISSDIRFVASENHQNIYYVFAFLLVSLFRYYKSEYPALLPILILNIMVSSGITMRLVTIIWFVMQFGFWAQIFKAKYVRIIYIALISIVIFISFKYSQNYNEIKSSIYSFSGRTAIWNYALDYFMKRPYKFLGYGQIKGSFIPATVISFWRTDLFLGTHNDFLAKLIYGGILYFILYLCGIYYCIVKCNKLPVSLKRQIIVIISMAIIVLLFDNQDIELFIPMLVLICSLINNITNVKRESNVRFK